VLVAFPGGNLVVVVLLLLVSIYSLSLTSPRRSYAYFSQLPVAATIGREHEALAVSVLVEVAAAELDAVRADPVIPPAVDVMARAASVGEEVGGTVAFPVLFGTVLDNDTLDLGVRQEHKREEDGDVGEQLHRSGIEDVAVVVV